MGEREEELRAVRSFLRSRKARANAGIPCSQSSLENIWNPSVCWYVLFLPA